MRDKDIINSIQHKGKTFYWILDLEYPNNDPISFFTSEQKISKKSSVSSPIIGHVIGAIIVLIGIILIFWGTSIISSSTEAAITMIVVGVIIAFISLSILTRGDFCEDLCCP